MNERIGWMALALLLVASSGRPACADVGGCEVWFAYAPSTHKSHLNAKQQDEIGERLTQAHMRSGGSDRHIVFICYLKSDDNSDEIYCISEPKHKIEPASDIYQITARDFTAMREAITVVEQEFKGGPSGRRIRKTTPEKLPLTDPRVSC